MAKNNLNAPIIRGSECDPYEPITEKDTRSYRTYQIFLYKNKKPVYRIRCNNMEAVKEAAANIMTSDSDLKMIIPMQDIAVNPNEDYNDVVVETF